MNKKKKYIPGAQTLGVQLETQKIAQQAKELEGFYKEYEKE